MGIFLTTIGRILLFATALAQTRNVAAKVVGHSNNDPISGRSGNINVLSPSSAATNLRKLGSVNQQISNGMGDDNDSGDSRDDDGQNSRRDTNICFTARQCNNQRLKMGLTKFDIGN